MSTNPPKIRYISESFIKPQYALEESKRPLYLTPWDLAMLSGKYMQKDFLFTKPPASNSQEDFIKSLLDRLKHSLSVTLLHFYPLAGCLVTQKNENPPSSLIFVDCSAGAKFIYADLDMTISDILSPIDAQGNNISITRPPIDKRGFPDGVSTIIKLPFTHQDEFISRFKAPKLIRERTFQFSSESIAKLKAKANAESNNKISSFQTLSALVWSVTMASSPRFNVYENEFGMGIAVALCCGNANKFDVKVSSYQGREGGGSIDLDVCLLPESMSALESDEEFMDAVSLSH
uniref:BAHD acyltransferase n=1 Tax=Quercus lobata TaxID=97700 RepID=A0A7N2MQA6_QUELO